MIPAFNCSGYLSETLECVLRQDRGPARMQIEVCDDASTDADVEGLVRKVAGDRVGYYRQPANVGSLRNFETCLNRSRGSLIHLLHGDDKVRDGFYEKMEELFSAHPEMGAAFSRFITVDQFNGATLVSEQEMSRPGILEGWLERLACKQRIQTPAMVVRRAVYERLGAFYGRPYGEDWEMWLRIAAHYPTGYLPEVLAEYRKHADSISGTSILTGQNIRDLKAVMEVARQYFTAEQWERIAPRARRAYAAYAIHTARSIWGRQQHRQGTRSQIAEALSLSAEPSVLFQAAKLYLKMLLRIKR
jgi:glycosyltransferase involved in cell wall biosynthesis